MNARLSAALWIGSALLASLALAVTALAALGTAERGIAVALQATARLAFLLFWLAYTGAALTALFGQIFQPLKRHGRELGLAFAAALLTHLALVGYLSYLWAAPPLITFIVFGVAAFWTYLLTLFSLTSLQRALGSEAWWLLRILGLNYIAFAFALDFLRFPLFGDIKHMAAYLPFAVLSILGPIIRLTAFMRRAHMTNKNGVGLSTRYRRLAADLPQKGDSSKR
jgi:hypothetical protein